MDIDAFILIGGRSSRLGRDKAFVELGGQTLASRAVATVEEALSPEHITFVTASDEQFDGRLVFQLGRPVVSDLKPGFGAWSGLHAALGYARAEWAFVLACDLPFVSVELLQFLALFAEGVDAVVARQQDGRLQPLCAFYRAKRARQLVDELFSGKDLMPQLAALVDKLDTRIVEFSEYEHLQNAEKLFANINTPEEFRAATAKSEKS